MKTKDQIIEILSRYDIDFDENASKNELFNLLTDLVYNGMISSSEL